MYQEFYSLKEKPFSLTPDPRFLYLSQIHRTAIESLLYGIAQREGFMVLTGDIGTGKTTICRALLDRLNGTVKTAVIFNSLLTEGELLRSILQDLGFSTKARSNKERIDTLNEGLIDLLSKGKNVALIIDEAQNLSVSVLEQIRMLSNLETEKEKMLQIVLVGQLELEQRLQSPKLKQLNQRIAIRHRLGPLTQEEAESYIHRRLMVAGAQGNITFSHSALKDIYQFSGGIPRLINLLCDRSLLAGFVEQSYHIDRELVQKAKKSLCAKEDRTVFSTLWTSVRRSLSFRISFLIVCCLLLAGLLPSSQVTPHWFRGGTQTLSSDRSCITDRAIVRQELKKRWRQATTATSGGRSP